MASFLRGVIEQKPRVPGKIPAKFLVFHNNPWLNWPMNLCSDSKFDCVRCRILFSIRLYHFQRGSLNKSQGFRAKYHQNSKFSRVIVVRLRCAESKFGCAGCRIEFSIRWYHFQKGSLNKSQGFRAKYQQN